MSLPRVSAHLPPYNPSKSTLAFGNRALPKIKRELSSNDVEVVRQALLLLADLLHKPENITSACREGLIHTLQTLLRHQDAPVKSRAATCLQLATEHALGRAQFVELQVIPSLAELFTDEDESVRLHAHQAVEMCSRQKLGALGILDAKLIPKLVERLLEEELVVMKSLILDTLHFCWQEQPHSGLSCRSIQKISCLLQHVSEDVRWRTARCLYYLTTPLEGKHTACQEGVVTLLVELLLDESELVRTHAAAAMMSIAVITLGKQKLLETAALSHLVSLLDYPETGLKLNAVKALTLLAEAPQGKHQLQSSLSKISHLRSHPHSVLSKAASTAYSVITWTP